MATDGGSPLSTGNYQVVAFEPEMGEGLARLQQRHWASGLRLNLAYLRWKYLENPYAAEPLIYVALDGTRVVGMRGIYGAAWDVGDGSAVSIPCAADTLIHPDHRDRGLFEELSDLALADLKAQGYTHVLNLSPTAANYVTSVVSMGWRSIGSTAEVSRASDVATARRRLTSQVPRNETVRGLARLGRRIRSSAGSNVFGRLDGRRAAGMGGVRVSPEPQPEEMAGAVAAEPAAQGITLMRDARYFAWRFRNPRADYRFLFTGEEELTGFMVLQNTIGRSRVNIVDWSARSDRDAAALLSAAIRGRFPDLRIWSRSLPVTSRQLLEENGFTSPSHSSEPTRLAGKAMVRTTSDPSDPSSWVLNGWDLGVAETWDLRMLAGDSF